MLQTLLHNSIRKKGKKEKGKEKEQLKLKILGT